MTFENSQEAIDYFVKFQAKIIQDARALEDLKAQYKKETKDYFQVADGEPMNLIQLVALMQRCK